MAKKRPQPAESTDNNASRTPPRTLYLVKRVQYKTFLRLEAALAPLGVSPAQFQILTSLLHGEKRSSASLSRIFAVKPQTMIKQIAILESRGLIARQLAKGNKRVLEVSMTDAGRVTLRACDKAANAVEAEIFAAFEPAEVAMYRALMLKILAGLRRMSSETEE